MTQSDTAPRVTVIIPVFNAEGFISQALDSVFAQSLQDFELLVVDDGSTDGTPMILQTYAGDPRLQVVTHRQNQGAPRTRNQALRLASGHYIAWLDADDYCAPERLMQQAAFLDRQPDVDVVACKWQLVDAHGTALSMSGRPPQEYSSDEIAARMLFACPIHHPTVMGRASVLRAYEYDVGFPQSQDHELWSRMIRDHRFAVLPQTLMFYRQHGDQVTASKQRMHAARRRVQAIQLEAMGISFTEQDLENHDQLFRLKGRRLFRQQTGRDLDMSFVRWARSWLSALMAANRELQRYPEPVFSRILGACWWRLCRKAAVGPAGMGAWAEFARSPMKGVALTALISDMRKSRTLKTF